MYNVQGVNFLLKVFPSNKIRKVSIKAKNILNKIYNLKHDHLTWKEEKKQIYQPNSFFRNAYICLKSFKGKILRFETNEIHIYRYIK